MDTRETTDQSLTETTISAHELRADDLLDRLIECCGEVTVLNHVQRKAWYPPTDPPDESHLEWLLLTVCWTYRGARPYVVMGRYNWVLRFWETPSGSLDLRLEVTAWTWMPLPKTADKKDTRRQL